MTKKVLCTLGPASFDGETIERLDELGVDLFRLNLSHTPVERLDELVELIREHSDVPICLDTQGAQVRTGALAGGTTLLPYGDLVSLVPSSSAGDQAAVSLYPASVLEQLRVDDLISVDFDTALLQVVEVGAVCRARVLSSGTIGSNKAASIIGRDVDLAPLSDADLAAIEAGRRLNVESVALSFANSRNDVEDLRRRVGKEVQLIAKIESRRGLENLASILEIADAIIIDRGDLSREVPMESIPFVQKDVIRRANEAAVPVYVATNLLESMVSSTRPTRAEVNDVMNTLLDGADGLVLAAETAVGDHPVECVKMVRTLIDQFEARRWRSTGPGPDLTVSNLVSPHGGKLVDRVVKELDPLDLEDLPRYQVDEQTMMDCHQIAVGAFSPLEGFMGREALESVLDSYRLPDGTVWTMPILLQRRRGDDFGHRPGDTVALTTNGAVHALLHVEECFRYDLSNLGERWFGTTSPHHPGVRRLLEGDDLFVSGKVDLTSGALEYSEPYELNPSQVRAIFEHLRWHRVVGFHTRNVVHRGHEYLMASALADKHCDGVFIHPVIGPKKSGDFSRSIILQTYEHLITNYWPPNTAILGGFATYSRYAGPREAVFTALCRKNFGCSHFIMGRDHTGVGDYYPPDASQRLLDVVGDIGMEPVTFDDVYYCARCRSQVERCQHGRAHSRTISGTDARQALMKGETLPDWYMREPISRLILEELRNGGEVFVP